MLFRTLFCAFLLTSTLFALPKGGNVAGGKASITSKEGAMTINSHGKTIINWDHFNIGRDETVAFIQDHAVLNRVTGGSVSHLLGKLTANGEIYLINPQGILIGNGAVIQTAGFLASTGTISDENFLQGETLSFADLGEGAITNLGKIEASRGHVILIARNIANRGTIDASEGEVHFAQAAEVVVNPDGKRPVFIRTEIPLEEGMIENSGTIQALAAEMQTNSPYAMAIRHQGTITTYATKEENGHIYLVADQGGAHIDGTLEAAGGEIHVLGKDIELTPRANLDVSKEGAAGVILIGGDFQGNNPDIQNSETLTVAHGAKLHADGHAGKVIAWSEKETHFNGKATARGGEELGDGGFIEISSREDLYHDGEVDTMAPHGKVGEVLYDPKFVIVNNMGTDPATGNTFGSDPSGTVTMSASSLASAVNSSNVTIQANTDITIFYEVNGTTNGNSLTLEAGRSIVLYDDILLLNGNFHATINATGAQGANRDAGAAVFQVNSATKILTRGGNLTVDVGAFGGSSIGAVELFGATLDAEGGNVSITGYGGEGSGITALTNTLVKTNGNGTLTVNGTGGTGANKSMGIQYFDSIFETENGDITFTGQGGGNGLGRLNVGVYGAGLIHTEGGTMNVTGTGGSGLDWNCGVYTAGNLGVEFSTVDGPITVTGQGGGSRDYNFGVLFSRGADAVSTGTGTITIDGTSGNGGNDNHGVNFSGGGIVSDTAAISITGQGQGTSSHNYGVRFEQGGYINSPISAPISIDGQGQGGDRYNTGVSISGPEVLITLVDGDLDIQGTSIGSGANNQGIRMEGGKILSTGTGASAANIIFTGVGGNGTDSCNGIYIIGNRTEVTSVDGDITLDGTANGSGSKNIGVTVTSPTMVHTTGSGTVSIQSTP